MKRILFISQSRLCHNLLQAVVPVVPQKVELTCAETIAEALLLPRRGAPVRLILVDWNALAEEKNGVKEAARFSEHRLLASSTRILLHSRGVNLPENDLREQNFGGFYAKPFLTEELVQIIEDHV